MNFSSMSFQHASAVLFAALLFGGCSSAANTAKAKPATTLFAVAKSPAKPTLARSYGRRSQSRFSVIRQQHPVRQVQLPPRQVKQARESSSTQSSFVQTGMASYYGNKFEGRRTASGEKFDQGKFTCAHGSLPFGCRIRVTNLRNRKSVEVKVNDRGGFAKHGRVIDLSKAAAKEIGMLGSGTAKVKIEVLR